LNVDEDGCDSNCEIEFGFDCAGNPSSCESTCGDGDTASDENCDDGNVLSGDGCSSVCEPEFGYVCGANGCVTNCGDAKNAGPEHCDDGNKVNGDGCSNVCYIEKGYTCTAANPSVCSSSCGDGWVVDDEQCDDGRSSGEDDEDGCSGCNVAEDWGCTGQPSNCLPLDAEAKISQSELISIVDEIDSEVRTAILAHDEVDTASITQVGETSWTVVFNFEDGTTDAEENNVVNSVANEIQNLAFAECLTRIGDDFGEDDCGSVIVLFAEQEGSVAGDNLEVYYTVVSDSVSVVCSLVLLSLSVVLAFL